MRITPLSRILVKKRSRLLVQAGLFIGGPEYFTPTAGLLPSADVRHQVVLAIPNAVADPNAQNVSPWKRVRPKSSFGDAEACCCLGRFVESLRRCVFGKRHVACSFLQEVVQKTTAEHSTTSFSPVFCMGLNPTENSSPSQTDAVTSVPRRTAVLGKSLSRDSVPVKTNGKPFHRFRFQSGQVRDLISSVRFLTFKEGPFEAIGCPPVTISLCNALLPPEQRGDAKKFFVVLVHESKLDGLWCQ